MIYYRTLALDGRCVWILTCVLDVANCLLRKQSVRSNGPEAMCMTHTHDGLAQTAVSPLPLVPVC
jgi:hypothetical protein